MAIIKFKKGNGAPTGLTLAEPAFDLTNNALYVGITGGVKWVGAEVDNTTSLGTSQIKIPTQFAVKTYVDNLGLSPGVLVTSLNGVTGAVLLGVTAGVGLSIVNPTGSGKGITLINTGVLSVNGESGAVINVARTNTTNSFSSLQTFTNGVSITNGATLSDILRIRGTITDPGGKIELWDEANTYKTTLQPEASTFKNTTFEFGGADGFVVAANTDGATSGWIVRAAGAGLSPRWIDPSATGFTAAGANIAVNLRAGAAGSLPYNTAASTTTFLGIGSAGTILTSTGSAPQWSTATGLTVGTAQQVSVTAETADTTTYVTFVGTNSNSNQALEYNSSLVYNAVTNYLEANIDGGSF